MKRLIVQVSLHLALSYHYPVTGIHSLWSIEVLLPSINLRTTTKFYCTIIINQVRTIKSLETFCVHTKRDKCLKEKMPSL